MTSLIALPCLPDVIVNKIANIFLIAASSTNQSLPNLLFTFWAVSIREGNFSEKGGSQNITWVFQIN